MIGLELRDIEVVGVPSWKLADMYKGLALNLAHGTSRARIESIRMSGFKAFNDRQVGVELGFGCRVLGMVGFGV